MHLKWDSIDKILAVMYLYRKTKAIYIYMDRQYLKGCLYSTYRDPAELKALTSDFPSLQLSPHTQLKESKKGRGGVTFYHLIQKQKQARTSKKLGWRTRNHNHTMFELEMLLSIAYSKLLVLQKGKQRLRERK